MIYGQPITFTASVFDNCDGTNVVVVFINGRYQVARIVKEAPVYREDVPVMVAEWLTEKLGG